MRIVSILFAILLVSATAFGALGDVITSFAAPTSYPIALARAPNADYTWVYCNNSPYNVYQFQATTGSVITSYNFFGSSTRGLSYQYGGYLFIGNSSTDYIYRTNANSIGSIYSSYAANMDMYGGLAVKGTGDGGSGATEIYSCDNSPSTVYLHNITTGSITGSWNPSAAIYDIAWDWRNNLVWGGYTSGSNSIIYGYNTAGSLAATFTLPASAALGMAYYGQYLWIGTTTGTHRIWQVHCPTIPGVGIAPTSLGKVKALYN